MAAEGDEDAIITYIFTGADGEVVPPNATHVVMHESVTAIPREAFIGHRNIVELNCHIGVKVIGALACYNCPRLKRLIIPGVELIIAYAFYGCGAVEYIECGKLKRIEEWAFRRCKSLRSINLPLVEYVGEHAFEDCISIKEVKFGTDLELIKDRAFLDCPSLERVTLPLKGALRIEEDAFHGCEKLWRINLLEEEAIHETIDALLLRKWRNVMKRTVESINMDIVCAFHGNDLIRGEKALVISRYIEEVLQKIIHYKEQHRELLDEAATTLQHALPSDMVMNNIIPFLQLPPHTFDGEVVEEEEEEEEG